MTGTDPWQPTFVPNSVTAMSLFEPLHSEACQAIVGGGIVELLTAKPSEAYKPGSTNWGQYNKSGGQLLTNPSTIYGISLEGTNYGLGVKKLN